MCGCSNRVIHVQNKARYTKSNESCVDISFYQNLLNNNTFVTEKQLLLKSLLRSQINIYNKDCNMFKQNIQNLLSEL